MDARAAAVLAVLAAIVVLGFAILGGSRTTTVTSIATVPSVTTVTSTSTVVSTTATTTTLSTTKIVVKEHVVEKIVLVDALGRTVVLAEPAKRVVSLAPSITEEVVALNSSRLLVGVDSYSKRIPGVPENAADVGGYWNPVPEKILSLHPDLVLACSGVPAQERLARQLEAANTTVFFTKCVRAQGWSDIEWDVEALGHLLGAEKTARHVVEEMEAKLAELDRRLANTTKPGVALIVYLEDKGAWVAGGGTFQDTMISTAGASNVFHSLYGWQMVSYETIISKNPDYIVVTTMGGPDAANKTLEKLSGTPLASTRAWRSGHVCVAYGALVDAMNRPSPRALLATEALASLLHPDAGIEPGIEGGFICNQAQSGGQQ